MGDAGQVVLTNDDVGEWLQGIDITCAHNVPWCVKAKVLAVDSWVSCTGCGEDAAPVDLDDGEVGSGCADVVVAINLVAAASEADAVWFLFVRFAF